MSELLRPLENDEKCPKVIEDSKCSNDLNHEKSDFFIFKNQQKAVVIEAFEASNSRELSLRIDDILILLGKDENDWFHAKREGDNVEGWFPVRCVSLLPNNTDTGNVSSSKSENEEGMGSTGSFHAPTNTVGIIDSSSVNKNRHLSIRTIGRFLLSRPSRQQLQQNNILPCSDASSVLVAAQKDLEKRKRSDTISRFLRIKKVEILYSIQLSKELIDFGGIPLNMDEVVIDSLELRNIGNNKLKWNLFFDGYNLPYKLTLEPKQGSLNKGKAQSIKVILQMKTLTSKTTLVKVISSEGKIVSSFSIAAIARKGVFGVDPNTLEKTNDNGFLVPVLLQKMRQNLSKFNAYGREGIFRISGDLNVIQSLKRQMDNKEFNECSDIYSVANLFKIWYRELPNPIFQSIPKESLFSDDILVCIQAVEALPEPEYTLLQYLIEILLECHKHVHENKMSVENLAIVIAPNLFRVEKDLNPLEGLILVQKHAKFFQNVVHGIILQKRQEENQDSNDHSGKEELLSSSYTSFSNRTSLSKITLPKRKLFLLKNELIDSAKTVNLDKNDSSSNCPIDIINSSSNSNSSTSSSNSNSSTSSSISNSSSSSNSNSSTSSSISNSSSSSISNSSTSFPSKPSNSSISSMPTSPSVSKTGSAIGFAPSSSSFTQLSVLQSNSISSTSRASPPPLPLLPKPLVKPKPIHAIPKNKFTMEGSQNDSRPLILSPTTTTTTTTTTTNNNNNNNDNNTADIALDGVVMTIKDQQTSRVLLRCPSPPPHSDEKNIIRQPSRSFHVESRGSLLSLSPLSTRSIASSSSKPNNPIKSFPASKSSLPSVRNLNLQEKSNSLPAQFCAVFDEKKKKTNQDN